MIRCSRHVNWATLHPCSPTATALTPQLMEVLQQVNKRVKGQPTLKLPCAELTKLLDASDPVRTGFVLMYLRMGAQRLDKAARAALVPQLLTGISRFASASAEGVRRRHGLVDARVCVCVCECDSPMDACDTSPL